MSEKWRFTGVSVTLFIVSFLANELCFAAAQEQKQEWVMVTSWPANFPILQDGADQFARRVEELTDGSLKIRVYAAGEYEAGGAKIGGLDVFDAVSKGIVQLAHSASYYWADKKPTPIPASVFFSSVPFGMTAVGSMGWLRHGGGLELWRELYRPFNIRPFPMGNSGMQMGGWFNIEIRSTSDFRNLKMRIPGLGGEVLKQFGAETVLMPPAEIFQKLERGEINAAVWIGPFHDTQMHLDAYGKYYYYPGWDEPGTTFELLVNKDAWESLTRSQQEAIEVVSGYINFDILTQFESENAKALRYAQRDLRARLRPFPDEVLSELRKKSDALLQAKAQQNPMFSRILDSYRRYQGDEYEWATVSSDAYRSGETESSKADRTRSIFAGVIPPEAHVSKDSGDTVALSLPGGFLFNSGSAELNPEASEKLAAIAAEINRNAHSKVMLEGHTDSEGDFNQNVRLSMERANAVKNALIAGGVAESRIDVGAFGPSRPIAPNTTNAGRMKNRRVVILLKPGY